MTLDRGVKSVEIVVKPEQMPRVVRYSDGVKIHAGQLDADPVAILPDHARHCAPAGAEKNIAETPGFLIQLKRRKLAPAVAVDRRPKIKTRRRVDKYCVLHEVRSPNTKYLQ